MPINDNYRVERRTINLYKSHVDGMTLIQHNDTMLIFDILGLEKASFTIEIILLHAVRSDGKKYVQEHDIAINGNELTILLEPRIVDIPGDVSFQLVFMDENASGEGGAITISSHIFRANVKPMLINGQSTAPPASEIMDKLYISSRAPQIDSATGKWKVYDNVSGKMVVTDYPSRGEGSEVDTAFDVNSHNAIANKTVAAKLVDVDEKNQALNTRVTSLEQNGGSGGGSVDYTKVSDALITTTNANATGGGGANVTAVQPNENDRSIHKLSATTDVAATDLLLLLSGRNIIPDKMSAWESGEYSADSGSKAGNANRIRLVELHPVIPSVSYYVSTNNTSNTDIRYVVRGYNKHKAFVVSIGSFVNGAVMTIPANVYYIGVTIYSVSSPAPVFADYQQLFANGQVKPFVGYNSLTDKTFVSYTTVTRVMFDGVTMNAGGTFTYDGSKITLNEADISGTYTAQLTALKAANLTAVISSNCKVTVTYNRSIVAAFAEVTAVLAAMVGG